MRSATDSINSQEYEQGEPIYDEEDFDDDRNSLIELSSSGIRLPPHLNVASIRPAARKRSCCTGRQLAFFFVSVLTLLYFGLKYNMAEVKWVVNEIESDLLGSRCNVSASSAVFTNEPSSEPYTADPVPLDYNFSAFEPRGGGRFAEYKDGDSPFVLTESILNQSDNVARSRRFHVLNAMKHVWKSYKENAFGKDELHPVSGKGSDNWGGIGTT